MNHVFMITSVGIFTAALVQGFVAVPLCHTSLLVSHSLTPPVCPISIIDVFYCRITNHVMNLNVHLFSVDVWVARVFFNHQQTSIIPGQAQPAVFGSGPLGA